MYAALSVPAVLCVALSSLPSVYNTIIILSVAPIKLILLAFMIATLNDLCFPLTLR